MLQFLLGVIAIVIVSIPVIWVRVRSNRRYLAYITQGMETLASGMYGTRLYEVYRLPAYRKLIEVLNRMASSVEEQVGEVSHERDVLQHILQSMTTGVVYITRRGTIQMANDAAARIFLRPLEQWVGREHWAVFRQFSLGTAIDDTLRAGTPWRGELKLRGDLTIDVRLVPIHTQSKNRLSQPMHEVLMICHDVSEWRRLERMRSEFVANVSHELKTPIAAIRGFAETILDGGVDEETSHVFLETIYEESKRMGMLVSDLLELSKLEGAQTPIELHSVALIDMIQTAVSRVRRQAEARNLRLHVIPCGDVKVWADEHRILQVMLNLLMNAIYYTPEGAEITVSCDIALDRVKVHVVDTGIGIAKEHLSRLFERFYRVNKDRSRASGGTGLGLAIAKHIVVAHGGEIGVNSEVGKGSDFWFTLSRLEGTGTHQLD